MEYFVEHEDLANLGYRGISCAENCHDFHFCKEPFEFNFTSDHIS